MNIASAYGHKGDTSESLRHMRQALTEARRISDPYILGVCLSNLGWLCIEEDRPDEAQELLTQALEVLDGNGIAQQLPPLHVHLAHLKVKIGRYAEAAEHARAAIEVREQGDHQSTGRATFWLGCALEGLGDLPQAIARWEESLDLFTRIGSKEISYPAEALARVGATVDRTLTQ